MQLKLEPYQEEMRDFLIGNQRAAAFVSPGLGKTAATLSAIKVLMAEGACKAALIIAPLRVATYTWPNEIKKWDEFKFFKVESLRGTKPSGKADIYITNYEQIQKLTNLNFCDLVVFDELTKAKNPKSERVKHLRPMLRKHIRWGLTGTPRPNSLLELFAQIRLLDDGVRLGKSYDQFKRTYFYPTDYMEYNWEPKPDAEKQVYAKIQDIQITQRASDLLKIPDTIVEDIEVSLSVEGRKVYEQLEKDLLVYLTDDKELIAQNAAILVNKLLQVAGGASYDEHKETIVIHDCKIEALKKLLGTKINLAERFIIAANYIHERERICKALPKAVDASDIKDNLEEVWNSGQIHYLVADPRSLGHGLNLQKGGSKVIWFSPTWSRELYDQFNARVARKGQEEITTIYRIIATGTIDEAVIELLRERGDSQNAMLSILTNYKKHVI
jgi:SNF2 family DNA or RNA helicase